MHAGGRAGAPGAGLGVRPRAAVPGALAAGRARGAAAGALLGAGRGEPPGRSGGARGAGGAAGERVGRRGGGGDASPALSVALAMLAALWRSGMLVCCALYKRCRRAMGMRVWRRVITMTCLLTMPTELILGIQMDHLIVRPPRSMPARRSRVPCIITVSASRSVSLGQNGRASRRYHSMCCLPVCLPCKKDGGLWASHVEVRGQRIGCVNIKFSFDLHCEDGERLHNDEPSPTGPNATIPACSCAPEHAPLC